MDLEKTAREKVDAVVCNAATIRKTFNENYEGNYRPIEMAVACAVFLREFYRQSPYCEDVVTTLAEELVSIIDQIKAERN